jgi:hypothetical protein
VIRACRHSALGPDGLPFSSCHAAGLAGVHTLFLTMACLVKGDSPPQDWNTSYVFPPKGDELADASEVIRTAANVRPINLQNTDNKIRRSTMNHSLSRLTSVWARPSRYGFIRGRNFLDNVVELDSHARVTDMTATTHIPIYVFGDFATAFPSIAHAFLFIALRAAGIPEAIIGFLHAMYIGNRVCAVVSGREPYIVGSSRVVP